MKKLIFACVILMFSVYGYAECPSADLTQDCYVDFSDFAVMASQWENEPNMSLLHDMVSQFLTEGIPEKPEVMVWVYINDSGVGMKDVDGILISHGGFTGEMSKYETTNAQYCEYLNAALVSGDIRVSGKRVYGNSGENNNQIFFDTSTYYNSYSQITYSGSAFIVNSRDGHSMAHHPVVEVSWYGATAFCDYYGFRLPTEWEWQAVADYDGSYTYGCGATIDQGKANYNDGGYANPLGLSSYPFTSPVDYYSSYGYGINDMAGNVFELTSSIRNDYRIIRGGGWFRGGSRCAVSNRGNTGTLSTHFTTGFRVCR